MSLARLSKDLFFVTAVHGTESIGVKALSSLSKKYPSIRWIIANEKALEAGVRYLKNDMNRSAPGDIESTDYEYRRIAEVLNACKNYKYTIDIHGTVAETGIFTIITRASVQNINFALSLPLKKIVIWESTVKKRTGPLTRFVPCGIEIECGSMDSRTTYKKLYNVIEKILKHFPDTSTDKEIFRVYGKLLDGDIIDGAVRSSITDFTRVNINGESFYPVLVNRYSGIICYKAKKIR